MTDINPVPFSLKRYRKLLDDPHQGDFMAIVKDGLETEQLLDKVLAFAEDHGWDTQRLLDHCFVAHVLLLNQLILTGYEEDIAVPPELMRLIRVMSVLDLSCGRRSPTA